MRNPMLKLGLAALLVAGQGQASLIPYPSPGTEAPATSGFYVDRPVIDGYFVGSDASYATEVFMIIGDGPGAITTQPFFFSATTSPGAYAVIYDSVAEGTDIAGKRLTFGLNVYMDGAKDDPTGADRDFTLYLGDILNPGGIQRGYVTNWPGGYIGGTLVSGSELGLSALYVAFEDDLEWIDFDYNDHQFVFRGMRMASETPEPSTWAMLVAGLGAVGLGAARRRRKAA